MKLTEKQLVSAHAALGVEPIPDDSPAMDELREAIGDHTFYLFDQGLLVFEPDADPETSESSARLTVAAQWADEEKTSLAVVESLPTQIVVDLETGEGGIPQN
jgi:hypothetical protein